MVKKKAICVLMAAITAFSFLGCGGSAGQTQESNGSTQEATQEATEGTTEGTTEDTAQASAPEDGDIWAAYDETVTISTVSPQNPSAVYPDGDDVTSNAWTRAYKEWFNIDVVTDWVSDEYDTKLNLSIAEGSIPDVFYVNASQLQQLIDADMIWDLTDIYQNYASDTIKGYIDYDPDAYAAGCRDGRLYGIPQLHYGYMEQPDYVWIRKDWREELGYDQPETMDELVEMMRAFMKEHGGYGMAAEQTMDYLNLIAIAWGAHPDAWVRTDSGEIQYGSIQPEMKEAVKAWAEWYKEGILSPDFATMNTDQMNQDVIAGKVGVQPYYQWWGWTPGKDEVTAQGQDAYFEPFMIPSANGEEVLQTIFYANNTFTVVSKNCEHPEAALKLINFFGYVYGDAIQEKGVDWVNEFIDKGRAHNGAFRVLDPISEEEMYVETVAALKAKDPSNIKTMSGRLRYDDNIEWEETHDPDAVGAVLQVGLGRCSYGLAKEILDNKQYMKSELKGFTPETILNTGTTLDDILTEGFTKIIIGDQPIEYFDTVVENWKKAGGEQATKEMNELYG